VVRAAEIIADRLGRVAAEEDRARVADAIEKALWIGNRELEMLGRKAIDQRRRIIEALQQDDRTMRIPALARVD
jgi:hypothetical protein